MREKLIIKTDRIDTDVKIAENDIRTVCDCIPYVQKEKVAMWKILKAQIKLRDENYNV